MGESGDHCVHLRGLPWSANVDDIVEFLNGCHISSKESGVHLTRTVDGKPSGEAFVELETEEDVKLALAKNKEHIGDRYIDVFKVKRSDLNWVFRRTGVNNDGSLANDCIIRLRGLPFNCSKEEIANFFTGMEIAPNGITILTDQNGRTSGDGFVQFVHPESVEKALTKDRETIGHRYVEIFRSNCEELMGGLARMCWRKGGGGGMMNQGGRGVQPYGYGGGVRGRGGGSPNMRGYSGGGSITYNNSRYAAVRDGYEDGWYGGGGYGMNFPPQRGGGRFNCNGSYPRMMGRGSPVGRGRGGGGRRGERFDSQTGHSVHLRGLPFSATEEDIAKFFSPIQLINIVIDYNAGGRPSGEADVDFASHEDAVESMKKHRCNINNRYIELFLRSSEGGRVDGYRGSLKPFNPRTGQSYGGDSYHGNYTPF